MSSFAHETHQTSCWLADSCFAMIQVAAAYNLINRDTGVMGDVLETPAPTTSKTSWGWTHAFGWLARYRLWIKLTIQ